MKSFITRSLCNAGIIFTGILFMNLVAWVIKIVIASNPL